MAKIYHIVKKANSDTLFRTVMLQAIFSAKKIDSNIDVYIASGFFNEIVNSGRTPVSAYADSMVGTNLRNLLSGLNVTVYGAYNGKNDLLEFCKNLKTSGAKIKAFYKYRFHTKLFVIKSCDKVIFEIIGSSNLTTSAYEGIRYTKTKSLPSYNSECDLILMSDSLDLTIDTDENIMLLEYAEQNKILFDERMNKAIEQMKIFEATMKALDV